MPHYTEIFQFRLIQPIIKFKSMPDEAFHNVLAEGYMIPLHLIRDSSHPMYGIAVAQLPPVHREEVDFVALCITYEEEYLA